MESLWTCKLAFNVPIIVTKDSQKKFVARMFWWRKKKKKFFFNTA